jgi:murein DD-endopeptidase MepM/ murein hydrolase activator NlpD
MIKLFNKLSLKKLYPTNLDVTLSLNKTKKTYIGIFSLIILTVFVIDATQTRLAKNLLNNKENFFNNQDMISLKKYIIKNINSPFTNIKYEVKNNDTLKKILLNLKVNNEDIDRAVIELKKYKGATALKRGSIVDITIKDEASSKKNSLQKLTVNTSKSVTVEVVKDEQGILVSEKIITKLFKKNKLAENTITKSLYASAMESNIEPNVIIEFARIFGFEIDFQRDIRKNDYFQILYEQLYDENDEFYKTGSIIYAFMSVNKRDIVLYKFGDDKNYGYYDLNGRSIEKALMKTPINGARLSSSYGLRKHPILGFTKKHNGTDFAAPAGTPIMASGSGTIIKAKWCGGGGNCIKIKHNSTYSTVYAHMKSFAKGMRIGKKVKQGQIIGYVGSTGMSTGPHLHYEVHINNKAVNSQRLKLPSGKVLKEKEREDFELVRIKTDVMIAELLAQKN